MNKEQFSDLLLVRNYEEVENTLKNGFDPNTLLEQDRPAIEWCAFSEDYQMIELLWKYGAKPTNEWIAEITKEFEKGKTFEYFTKSKDSNNNLKDLSNEFSIDKLEFLKGFITIQNKYCIIDLPISKFLIDSQEVNTSLRFDSIILPDEIEKLIGKKLNFPVNPEKGYVESSIYIKGSHIPIDLTAIEFKQIDPDEIIAEFELTFNFEFESIGFQNENLKVEITLINNVYGK